MGNYIETGGLTKVDPPLSKLDRRARDRQAKAQRRAAFYRTLPGKKVNCYSLAQVFPGDPDCRYCKGTGIHGHANRRGEFRICAAPWCALYQAQAFVFFRWLGTPEKPAQPESPHVESVPSVFGTQE